MMSTYNKTVSKIITSKQLRELYDILDNEERRFSLTAKKQGRGRYNVTITTHILSEKYFYRLINSLGKKDETEE